MYVCLIVSKQWFQQINVICYALANSELVQSELHRIGVKNWYETSMIHRASTVNSIGLSVSLIESIFLPPRGQRRFNGEYRVTLKQDTNIPRWFIIHTISKY